MIGQKFGMLTVISEHHRDWCYSKYWLCKCDCGKTTVKAGQNLRSGATKSCGCAKRKHIDPGEQLSSHPLYTRYAGIISRCHFPGNKNYKYYGGRGISVCDRWRHSFKAFLQDMGDPPFEKAQLDRIDNNGNYEPGNVRWATSKENCNNRKR